MAIWEKISLIVLMVLVAGAGWEVISIGIAARDALQTLERIDSHLEGMRIDLSDIADHFRREETEFE